MILVICALSVVITVSAIRAEVVELVHRGVLKVAVRVRGGDQGDALVVRHRLLHHRLHRLLLDKLRVMNAVGGLWRDQDLGNQVFLGAQLRDAHVLVDVLGVFY